MSAEVNPDCGEATRYNQGSPGFQWKTRVGLLGIPLVCIAYGSDETGKVRIAKGFIAIGRIAVGGLAIGQYAVGFGDRSSGVRHSRFRSTCGGPCSRIWAMRHGFFRGRAICDRKVPRGQFGWAEHLWSPGHTDMEAVAMFETVDWLVQQDIHVIWENIKDAINLGI